METKVKTLILSRGSWSISAMLLWRQTAPPVEPWGKEIWAENFRRKNIYMGCPYVIDPSYGNSSTLKNVKIVLTVWPSTTTGLNTVLLYQQVNHFGSTQVSKKVLSIYATPPALLQGPDHISNNNLIPKFLASKWC